MNVNKIKKSPSKFSNISIFDRREENILYVKNLKRYIPLKLTNVKRKVNREEEIKKKNSEINDILYSFYVYQTSEGNREKTVTDSNNPTFTSLFNKTYNNFQNSSTPFYLTETDISSYKAQNSFKSKKKNVNKYIKLKKNFTEENKDTNLTNNCIFPNNKKLFSRLSDYFQEIDKEKKPKIGYNKTSELLEMKSNKLRAATQDNFYNTKQYIDKTRKVMLMKYNSLIQNEVKLRINENYDNSLQLMNDKINSLNKLKKFQNEVFSDKLLEYVKFIKLKQDNEEKYDLSLLNQIYSLRSEISLLTNKIRKIQTEKNNIIQWILLQIKVKERKLYLPSYYSKIFEMNIPKAENSDNIFNDVNEEEIKKVLYYRKNLIFKNVDEFMEELKIMENKNIKLFKKTDMLLYDIKKLKEKYNNLLNDKDFCNSSIIIQIKKDENELEENKKIFKEKKKFMDENLKNNNINKNNEVDFELIDDDINLNNKKSKLLQYVEKLFSTCQEIKIKKNFSKSTNDDTLINVNKTEEDQILHMMEFIEVKITKLLLQISIYKTQKKSNNELIKKLRMDFTKKRNFEKAKREYEKKNLKLFREIEVKNGQLLFLKKNKKDLQNHLAVINTQLKNRKKKKIKITIPKLEDFLFSDVLEDNKECFTCK